jgi:DNA modification methylase
MNYTILEGDNRLTLKTIPDNTIDAIVTDPPYGIDFLGKDWDANTGALETYQECLRVLKPGGHILAFSAARTYHHLAITLEQAGFEIRDQIMWIYSSGFPKSQDIGRSIQRSLGVKEHYTIDEWEDKQGYTVNHPGETHGFGDPNSKDGHGDAGLSGKIAKVTDPEAQKWEGWGTQLKPAHEPIALARKPMKLSIARNCQQWGVGALNIDATRIASTDLKPGTMGTTAHDNYNAEKNADQGLREGEQLDWIPSEAGRFPSNVIGEIEEPYQKYFYCPKVSRRERHVGFDQSLPGHWEMAQQMGGSLIDHQGNPCRSANKAWLPDIGEIYTHGLSKHYLDWCKKQGISLQTGNNHPTVKPVALMKYLISLITPAGGTVLDPFTGSGSTGCAAVELGHTFTGCELDPRYVDIARTRIEAWNAPEPTGTTFEALFE